MSRPSTRTNTLSVTLPQVFFIDSSAARVRGLMEFIALRSARIPGCAKTAMTTNNMAARMNPGQPAVFITSPVKRDIFIRPWRLPGAMETNIRGKIV